MEQFPITQFLVGPITGILVAFAAVLFANTRYKAERKWDRKFQAYEAILDALHHMTEETSNHLDAAFDERKISEEKNEELRSAAKVSLANLKREAAIGSFIVSEEAESRLNRLFTDLSKASDTDDYYEFLENEYAALSSAMKDIKSLARDETKI